MEYRIRALTEYSYRYYELYPLFPVSGKKEMQMDSVLDYCRQLEEELLELCRRNPEKESYLKLHVSLMQATAQYCIPQGYYREGAACIEKALKSNVLAGDDPREKIRCLRFLIYQQINLWEMERTEEYLEESLILAEKNGLQEDHAITCRLYGLYLSMKGRFGESMEFLKKSLEFFMNAPLKSRIYALNIAACYNYMERSCESRSILRRPMRITKRQWLPVTAITVPVMPRFIPIWRVLIWPWGRQGRVQRHFTGQTACMRSPLR